MIMSTLNENLTEGATPSEGAVKSSGDETTESKQISSEIVTKTSATTVEAGKRAQGCVICSSAIISLIYISADSFTLNKDVPVKKQ